MRRQLKTSLYLVSFFILLWIIQQLSEKNCSFYIVLHVSKINVKYNEDLIHGFKCKFWTYVRDKKLIETEQDQQGHTFLIIIGWKSEQTFFFKCLFVTLFFFILQCTMKIAYLLNINTLISFVNVHINLANINTK